jgi:hypothetical protein
MTKREFMAWIRESPDAEMLVQTKPTSLIEY